MLFREMVRKVFLWPGKLSDKNAADDRAPIGSETCNRGQEQSKGKRLSVECDPW